MNTNPLHLLDSLLSDWASPRVRRLIHGLLLLAAVIIGIWLAVDGDWKEFVAAMIAAVYAASNVANTPAVDLAPAGVDRDVDDGLTYEESGGLPLDEYPDEDPADEPLAFDAESEKAIYQPEHRRDI